MKVSHSFYDYRHVLKYFPILWFACNNIAMRRKIAKCNLTNRGISTQTVSTPFTGVIYRKGAKSAQKWSETSNIIRATL